MLLTGGAGFRMPTEMGEYVVGAWLRVIAGCDFVNYNVRSSATGLEGLAEFDVTAQDLKTNTVYLCEVVTHLDGINYGGYDQTIQKIAEKHARQREFAARYLISFTPKYMFWAPRVPVGYMTDKLSELKDLHLIINEGYTQRIAELREQAHKTKKDIGNPFFRALQILEHLRS